MADKQSLSERIEALKNEEHLKVAKMGRYSWYSDVEVEQGFSGGPVVRAATGELLGLTWGANQRSLNGRVIAHEHCFIDADAIRKLLNTYLRVKGDAPPAREREYEGLGSIFKRALGRGLRKAAEYIDKL